MGTLRKVIIVISSIAFAASLGISIYFSIKAKPFQNRYNQDFNAYVRFQNANTYTVGCEGFYKSTAAAKKAKELRDKIFNNEDQKAGERASYWGNIGLKISIMSIAICLTALEWNLLRKSALGLFNNSKKAIVIFAAALFLSTWLIPPWISSGYIRYDFILTPLWNGSRIFWALLLVEWTFILLPLGLIYKRLSDKAKMRETCEAQ